MTSEENKLGNGEVSVVQAAGSGSESGSWLGRVMRKPRQIGYGDHRFLTGP